MKKIYQKLVRDRIPEIIAEAGKDFSIRIADKNELLDYALKKLQEETQEFIESPSPEEAGDIIEILHFICDHKNIRKSEVIAEATAKHVSRGGFSKSIILEWVED